MSIENLKEAVLDIAEEMLREVEDLKDKPGDASASYMCSSLRGYSRQLRTACKASSESPPIVSAYNTSVNPFLTPQMQHIIETEKARKEFSKSNKGIELEEAVDGDMVDTIDSKGERMFTSIPPSMPIGARTTLDDGAYQLRMIDGKRVLQYDDDMTKKMIGSTVVKNQDTLKILTGD